MCIAVLAGVLLTNPLTAKASFEIGDYTLQVPSGWKVAVGDGELRFEKNNIPFGGVQILGYESGQPLPLPNHAETKNQKDLEGLITKAVLVNLDLTQPAASGDSSVTNESHLYLLFADENKAYDLYANTKYIKESDLLKIAQSFELAARAAVKEREYDAGLLLKFRNPYVGNHVNVGSLFGSLPYADMRSGFSLQTEKPPYGITVDYDFGKAGTDLGQVETAMRNHAIIVFALIDNVDNINFNIRMGSEERKIQYSRTQLQQNLRKNCGSTPRK